MKRSMMLKVSFLVLAILSGPVLAAETESTTIKGVTTGDTNCKIHCELSDLAKKCADTEKKSIKCIDEIIVVLEKAKASKKKKEKDEALDKAQSLLKAIKKKDESTICVMEIMEKRNRELKGHVEKVKKELSIFDSMFKTPATEPFMYGPYF
ncbi:MAG: hypothetical protein K8F91_06855 [Candidatus Obscuribacterales bacterium]|nr:hypothetical protein [Candidatus Obscuribacterales bacterium]